MQMISDIENEYSSALLKNSSNTNANINVNRKKRLCYGSGKER